MASEPGSQGDPRHAVFAVLPAAVGVAILLARILPVEFEARPNDLGIVSRTILDRYPDQQKTFWLLFGVSAVALLTWLGVRAMGEARRSTGRGIALEGLGACVLAAVLWLPAAAGAAAAALLLATAAWLAWPRTRDLAAPARDVHARPPPRRSRASRAGWAAAVLLLAVCSGSGTGASRATDLPLGLWSGIANVAHAISDRDLVRDSFGFHSEWGQHLAWADAMRRGDMQGRDFYSLYGPLYHLSLLGVWSAFGRSIAAFTLWQGLLVTLGMAALACLVLVLVRRRAVFLALPFLAPYVHLRIGLALAALACLCLWQQGGRRAWCALAGALGGSALLFSQEFGLAFLLTAVLLLALAADARAGLAFAASFAAVVAPVLLYFAGRGALAPMLSDLVEYPRYVVAGFGNRPFAPLLASLPLGLRPTPDGTDVFVRLGYSTPLVCVAAILLVLPLAEMDPRSPLRALRGVRARLLADPQGLCLAATGLFGLLVYRAALGRSDMPHLETVLGPAAALSCAAIDRCAGLWAGGRHLRALAAWRSAALALFLWQSGFLGAGRPLADLAQARDGIELALAGRPAPGGAPRALRVVDTVARHTRPEDPVLFLPNDASYYYLTGRANPTRFVLAHQIVTDAHRREALDDLRRRPPRLIVRDLAMWDVDEIPLRLLLGPETIGWIRDRYRILETDDRIAILERRDVEESGR